MTLEMTYILTSCDQFKLTLDIEILYFMMFGEVESRQLDFLYFMICLIDSQNYCRNYWFLADSG